MSHNKRVWLTKRIDEMKRDPMTTMFTGQTTVYEVHEQWPHEVIASFRTMADAETFLRASRARLAMPIIVSRQR